LNATNVNMINMNANNITTGTLNAARIGANTITANHMRIADTSELSQINPRAGVLLSGHRDSLNGGMQMVGSHTVPGYAHSHISRWSGDQWRTRPIFNPNEQINISFNFATYRPVGTGFRIIIRAHYTTGSVQDLAVGHFTHTAGLGVNRNSINLTIGAIDTSREIREVDIFIVNNSVRTGWSLINDVSVRRRYGGNLIVEGSIQASHIAVGTITADKINVTNGLRIGNYFMDPTAISTIRDQDFVIRRNRDGNDQINRLVVSRNNIRFYSEERGEDGGAVGGITGHMLITHNRLTAENNPNHGSRLINLHLQPANRNLGRATMQGIANTEPGEVRATYNTGATGVTSQVYAPLRCAYLAISGQTAIAAGTHVSAITSRHIGVNMANSRIRFGSGARPNHLVGNVQNSSRVSIEVSNVHGNTFSQYSSKEFKDNIISLQENDNGYGLDLIKSLEITEFDYIDECENNTEPLVDAHSLGVILEETNPKIVGEEGDSVNLTTVLWSNVLATQQLLQRIEAQEKQIETQRIEIQKLKKQKKEAK